MTIASRLLIEEHFVDNHDGWELHLKVTRAPEALRTDRRPLLIVPGYGMNAFIFGYHPKGTSLEACLALEGFEVWSVNLRRQGMSRPTRKSPPGPSLRAYAEVDVTAAVDAVRELTRSELDRVDVLGASLGGSIVFGHLVLNRQNHLASVVAIGSPLRWVKAHPLLKLAFRSPALVERVRFSGTRRLARVALPALAKFPQLLSIYMNTELVDLTHAPQLTRTVDDPHPRVNKDIAKWVGHKDMVLRGVNITEALREVDNPLLVVLANRDGIVPPEAALSACDAWGGDDVEVLEVGDDREWYAHADLFIGDPAPERVFAPLARWLHEHH